jgi:hypothetical protein
VGQTEDQLEVPIFLGPTYYQRLPYAVVDSHVVFLLQVGECPAQQHDLGWNNLDENDFVADRVARSLA